MEDTKTPPLLGREVRVLQEKKIQLCTQPASLRKEEEKEAEEEAPLVHKRIYGSLLFIAVNLSGRSMPVVR